LITIEIKDNPYHKGDVWEFALTNNDAIWIDDWNIEDDLKIDFSNEQTFLLNSFLAGFSSAYNEEYIYRQNIKIK